MLKLIPLILSLLIASGAYAQDKVKRTADNIKVPERSTYSQRYKPERQYDENG